MLIVDLNLLLYATNRDAPDHAASKSWWESALNGDVPVGLPWVVLLGFLRIATHPRIFASPLSFEQAADVVDEWMEQPLTRVVHPTERHWGILKELLAPFGTTANLVADGHIAALAIEHGAVLCSADRDFGRFARLHWKNPLESSSGGS